MPVILSRVGTTAAHIFPFDDDKADPTVIGIPFIPACEIVPGLTGYDNGIVFDAGIGASNHCCRFEADLRFVADRAGPVAIPPVLLQRVPVSPPSPGRIGHY